MHFLNRDLVKSEPRSDVRSDEETRFDLPSIASLELLRPSATALDLERAERLRADTVQYAVALKQQLDILVDAYDTAFAKWTQERAELEARLDGFSRRQAYLVELEDDLFAAWERIEQLQVLYDAEQRDGEFFRRELESANRVSADRERRLTLAVFEAQQAEARATAVAEQHAEQVVAALREADAATRRAEEHRERADWAADERARLAKCYEDACLQAAQIEKTAAAVEHETSMALAAKDVEIEALKARCSELESTLLEQINASIREAREESERLSALVMGVQQGRFWKFKRAAQRVRNLIRR